jgi:hypothetical protein
VFHYFTWWVVEREKIKGKPPFAWLDNNIYAVCPLGSPCLGATKLFQTLVKKKKNYHFIENFFFFKITGDARIGLELFLSGVEIRDLVRSFGAAPWLFPLSKHGSVYKKKLNKKKIVIFLLFFFCRYHFNLRDSTGNKTDFQAFNIKHLLSKSGANATWEFFERYYCTDKLYLRTGDHVNDDKKKYQHHHFQHKKEDEKEVDEEETKSAHNNNSINLLSKLNLLHHKGEKDRPNNNNHFFSTLFDLHIPFSRRRNPYENLLNEYKNLPKALQLPPVRKIYSVYGVNVETEVNYYFKVDSNNTVSLDNGADQIPTASHLKTKAGVVLETKDTPHKVFNRDGNQVTVTRGGDGTVPWESLSYVAVLANELNLYKKELDKEHHKKKFHVKNPKDDSSKNEETTPEEDIWNDIVVPDVKVMELEGVVHRDMLKHSDCISIVIDLACGLGVPNRFVTKWE